MKAFLVMFSLMMAGSAFAISDNKLIKKCTPPATEEIHRLANLRNCTIVNDEITLTDIDNRMLNPFKYLRFAYQAICEGHEEVLNGVFVAQYFKGECYISN